jgi:hypothetical protein
MGTTDNGTEEEDGLDFSFLQPPNNNKVKKIKIQKGVFITWNLKQ